MDTKDYQPVASLKPEALNFLLNMSIDGMLAQKSLSLQSISSLAKKIQVISSDVESMDTLVKIKVAGYRFGDLFYEYTDEQLEAIAAGMEAKPAKTYRLVGVVGKWATIENIHSANRSTYNVSNFPSKNFVKK